MHAVKTHRPPVVTGRTINVVAAAADDDARVTASWIVRFTSASCSASLNGDDDDDDDDDDRAATRVG
jgi:streptomycin 6-kinase